MRVEEARCVLFAYHEMGFACMRELAAMRAPIAALFTHPDDPHEEIWWRSCGEFARAEGIPVFMLSGVDDTLAAKIKSLRPAIIYSVAYRHLLPEELLESAPLGAYNLHPSLLPKYRGRAPVNWMIVNGEREGGVTLHHMVARADAGDVVAQRSCAIDDSDTALALYRKLVPLGADLLRQYHPLIAAGSAPRIKQDLSKGSYFGRRRPEDGRIDWRWPARRVFNLVRAVTHPYPGAYCYSVGKKLFVWDSRIVHEDGTRGAQGEVVAAKQEAIEVAAGQGSVLLVRMQYEGEPERSAGELFGAGASTPRALL